MQRPGAVPVSLIRRALPLQESQQLCCVAILQLASAPDDGAFFVVEREKINDGRVVDRLIDADGDIMYETERKLNQIRANDFIGGEADSTPAQSHTKSTGNGIDFPFSILFRTLRHNG